LGQLQQSLAWISRQTAGSTGTLSTGTLWVNRVNFRSTLPAGASRAELQHSCAKFSAATDLYPERGWAEGDAPTLSGRGRTACFGPWAVGAAARLGVGGEEALVLWLRGGARGGGGRQGEDVRGLPAEAANLWAAGGREEAVVLRQCKSSEGSWSNDAADACSDHGCDCAGGHRDGSGGDGNDTGGC
jgi:hypothetical protein